MREPWISSEDALRERMSDPAQVGPEDFEAQPPPYAVSFLAHLRLLVGLPFEYLVPDTSMLPDESIRFFHLDRSWTDRLVDGVIAVGKIGSREQAHHHAAAPALQNQLDTLEPAVRPLQRGLAPLQPQAPAAQPAASGGTGEAITGFLLRSAVVAGWPHMDVRAYYQGNKLTLLRLERLSRSVLITLIAGIPDRIELEEPHHGVQFGATQEDGQLVVDRRRADGYTNDDHSAGSQEAHPPFPVAFRATDPTLRVVEISALRRLLSYRRDQQDPSMPIQNGSAAFAIELLQPPWQQVFSDEHPTGHLQFAVTTAPSVAALTDAIDTDALVAELDTLR